MGGNCEQSKFTPRQTHGRSIATEKVGGWLHGHCSYKMAFAATAGPFATVACVIVAAAMTAAAATAFCNGSRRAAVAFPSATAGRKRSQFFYISDP